MYVRVSEQCPVLLLFEKMALLQYMKPVDCLSDPKGPLTSSLSAQAITEANTEVQKAMGQSRATGKKQLHPKALCICDTL